MLQQPRKDLIDYIDMISKPPKARMVKGDELIYSSVAQFNGCSTGGKWGRNSSGHADASVDSGG